jgi:hypothetical protein
MNTLKSVAMAVLLLILVAIPASALKISVEATVLVCCLVVLCGIMVELTALKKHGSGQG